MSYQLEQVRGGQISAKSFNYDKRKIIWNNRESSAGVYLPIGNRFLFAEVCHYYPIPYRKAIRWPTDDDSYPFQTDAEQIIIDLENSEYVELNEKYEEGEVQGLVYAVDAIQYGRKLEPDSYWNVIEGWVDDVRNEEKLWTDLSQSAFRNYINLGFIRS